MVVTGKASLKVHLIVLSSTASSVVPSPNAPALVQAGDARIDDVVLPGEDHVLGGEGIAVRPLGALDQMHGELLAVVGPFPGFGELRQRLDLLRRQHPHRAGAHQAHHGRVLGAAVALVAAGDPVPALRPAADHVAKRAAVDAGAVGRHRRVDDQRLLRQPLLDRRQLAGLDELRHPFRLVIGGQRAVVEQLVVGHQDRLGGRNLLRLWIGDRAFKLLARRRRREAERKAPPTAAMVVNFIIDFRPPIPFAARSDVAASACWTAVDLRRRPQPDARVGAGCP